MALNICQITNDSAFLESQYIYPDNSTQPLEKLLEECHRLG